MEAFNFAWGCGDQMRISIKPLSVNKAWRGRRFKTDEYKRYERDVLLLLRPMAVPPGDLFLKLVFGFSSKLSDFDNPVKPFVDCLQKKYKFNDRLIKKAHIDIEAVAKGGDFIDFQLVALVGNKHQEERVG